MLVSDCYLETIPLLKISLQSPPPSLQIISYLLKNYFKVLARSLS